MQPTVINDYSVRAKCPDCNGAISNFDHKASGEELGFLLLDITHSFKGKDFSRIHWRLLQCSGCGRAGLAKFHDHGRGPGTLESFFPRSVASSQIPAGVPEGIIKEYREAELCTSVEAFRAASALVRSTLEKTLKENGYLKGSLQKRIDDAANDGVITAARKQKAHEDIRVLGNEVIHDEWREISEEEVVSALHYAQRILEDLYDDRNTVLQILINKGRLAQTDQERKDTN
jgi:hypothetical protein